MKRRLLGASFAALVFAVLLGHPMLAFADPLYTISGHASGVGSPALQSVAVEAWSGSELATSTVTDALGYYTLSVPAGDYRLRFDPAGHNTAFAEDYAPWWWNFADWAETSATATPIHLDAAQPTQSADEYLLRYARVFGTVTSDVDAQPLPGVDVLVQTAEGDPVAAATTDGDGEFLIKSLPQGEYVVRFDAGDRNGANPGEPYYVPAETPPSMHGWSDTQDLSRQMTPVSIHGVVQRHEFWGNPPVPGTLVELWDAEGVVATATSGPFGEYDLYPRPGTYELRFDPAAFNEDAGALVAPGWWPSEFLREDGSTVTVSEQDPAATCDQALEQRFIVGEVSDQYDGKTWLQGVRVSLLDEQGAEVTSTVTDENGRFAISPLPDGTYYVHYGFTAVNATSERHYSDQWYPGTVDRDLANPVTIDGNGGYPADLNPLPDARVEGVLQDQFGQPAAGVSVRLWDFTNEVTSTVTDALGAYSLPVTPQVARFLYIDSSARNALNDPDLASGWYWFGMLSPTASNRSVLFEEPNEVRTADVTLNPSQAIFGRVVGSHGEPIDNVTVEAVPVPRPDLTEEELGWVWQAATNAITDSSGAYRISFEPGLFDLVVGFKVHFLPGGDQYVAEWFDDQTEGVAADLLPMQAGSDRSVDATLAECGSISGHVLTAAGEPMPWVTIGVRAVGSAYTVWGNTDQEGDYRIAGLPAGDYTVEVDPGNFNQSFEAYYEHEFWNDRSSEESADPVTVAEGTDSDGIDFSLREAVGALAGHVEDAAGEPLAGTAVQAEQPAGPDEESPGEWQVVAQSTVGEDGDYRFDRLPSGDYRIRFSPQSENLAAEWYADAHRASEAETVTVETGLETSDVDAVLEPVGHITGSVHDEQTEAPLNLAVYAFVYDNGEWTEVGRAVSSAEDGTYDLRLSVDGPVRLQFGTPETGDTNETFTIGQRWFVREAYPDAADYLSGEDVEVTLSETTSADATITRAASIAGFVGFNAALGEVTVAVQRLTEDGWKTTKSKHIDEWDFPDGPPPPDWLPPVGFYTIDGIAPGTYRVRFRDAAGYYLTQYFESTLSADEARLIELAPGETLPNVDAAMRVGGSIRGRLVLGDDGHGFDGATIALYRGVNGSWTYVRSENCDENGDFAFAGLETGHYTLVASAEGNRPEAWQNRLVPDFDPNQSDSYVPPVWSTSLDVYAGGRTVLPEAITLESGDTLDEVPPVSSCDVPSGWVGGDVVVHISATDNAGSAVGVFGGVGNAPLTQRSMLPTISTEGITTIRFRAVDAQGNWESTRTAEVRIDKSPPITDDDALSGYRTKAIVRFFPRDRYSGPAETHFVLDDEPEMIGSAAVTSEQGEHSLRYWSVDAAGNVEAPHEITFMVGADLTPPVTTAVAPIGWTKSPALVTLSAEDDNLGVDATYFAADGTVPKYIYLTPISIAAEGRSLVTYRSIDRAGNEEAMKWLEVWVDGTKPTTTASVVRVAGRVTVTLTPSDASSGVARTNWVVDGAVEGTGTTVAIDSIGPHSVAFSSRDAVGNIESTKTIDVVVPEATSLSLAANAAAVTYGGSVRLDGVLLNSTAAAIPGRADVLGQFSYNGSTWTTIGSASFAAGHYAISHIPDRLVYYRLAFNLGGVDAAYVAATSPVRTVRVAPTLSLPTLPTGLTHGKTFTLWTLMRPKHSAGKSNVTFQCYRYESRKWVLRKTVAGTNATSGSATKVSGATSLPAGTWRVRAYHPADTLHVAAYSAYRSFRVQ